MLPYQGTIQTYLDTSDITQILSPLLKINGILSLSLSLGNKPLHDMSISRQPENAVAPRYILHK